MDHNSIVLVEDGQDSHILPHSSPNKVYGRYAMERTPAYIKVWFWSRQDPSVPWDVRNMAQTVVDTNCWGTPVAFFPNTDCDISSKFGDHHVIINLTFCKSNFALVVRQFDQSAKVVTGLERLTLVLGAQEPALVCTPCILGENGILTLIQFRVSFPDYVNNNPAAFENAFWDINAVRMYGV
jgi:hypothetical protein